MQTHPHHCKSFSLKILPINPYNSKICMLSSVQLHCFHRPRGEGVPTPGGCPKVRGGHFFRRKPGIWPERGRVNHDLQSLVLKTRSRTVILRYTRPDMGRIWSEENRFRTWLTVEVAATETLAQAGLVPKSAARAIRERADFNLERIQEIEAEVRHDVIAFTTAVAEIVGPEARWFHYGLTSNDVVDTAQALLIGQASEIILQDLRNLIEVLQRRAFEFKDTPMVGRTHGVHAEPITFGLKLANWYDEAQRDLARFQRAAEEMRVGKFSGAVGNFAHLNPELEEKICARLGLKAAPIT